MTKHCDVVNTCPVTDGFKEIKLVPKQRKLALDFTVGSKTSNGKN